MENDTILIFQSPMEQTSKETWTPLFSENVVTTYSPGPEMHFIP